MKQLVLREYERVPRSRFPKGSLRVLEELDKTSSHHERDTVFDWSRKHEVRVQNYVGVIQTRELAIEILPKTDEAQSVEQVRRNLLHMLLATSRIPARERGLASLHTRDIPMFDAMIELFVARLLSQLHKGLDQEYVEIEENSNFVRGKLVLGEHLRRNPSAKDRVYVRRDEFLADTWMNRTLKAACRKLLRQARYGATLRRLKEAVLRMSEVTDCNVQPSNVDQILYHRGNERFRSLVNFARIVLFDGTPDMQAGAREAFSLLVPMERLFEEFIGSVIRRNARALGFTPGQIRVQARGNRKHLLRQPPGRQRYRLKPDVLIQDDAGECVRVLDTKWKRLDRRAAGLPSEADMYQLYAYSQRYKAPMSVLLYPRTSDAQNIDFEVEGDVSRKVRVAFVDLSRDLRRAELSLVSDLASALVATTREPLSAPELTSC